LGSWAVGAGIGRHHAVLSRTAGHWRRVAVAGRVRARGRCLAAGALGALLSLSVTALVPATGTTLAGAAAHVLTTVAFVYWRVAVAMVVRARGRGLSEKAIVAPHAGGRARLVLARLTVVAQRRVELARPTSRRRRGRGA
jgi:hypothetical protein